MAANTLAPVPTPANPPMKLKCAWIKCGREFEPKPRIDTRGRNRGIAPGRRFCSEKCRRNSAREAFRLRNLRYYADREKRIREIGNAVNALIAELGLAEARRKVAILKGMTEKAVAHRHIQHKKRKATRRKSRTRPEGKLRQREYQKKERELIALGKLTLIQGGKGKPQAAVPTAAPKPKHAGGRPIDPERRSKVEVMIQQLRRGVRLKDMAPLLWPKNSKRSAETNTRKLRSEFRAEIDARLGLRAAAEV
jgi:hypothetical protein